MARQSMTFANPVQISANTTYVGSYDDPQGHYAFERDLFDWPLNTPPLSGPFTWSFSTGAVAQCPCGIWQDAAPTGAVDAADPSAVTLGLKFQASSSGTITGIRFYKETDNTGTHIGSLWTASGTLLASGTFTSETTPTAPRTPSPPAPTTTPATGSTSSTRLDTQPVCDGSMNRHALSARTDHGTRV